MGTHVQRYDGQINFMGKIKKKKKIMGRTCLKLVGIMVET